MHNHSKALALIIILGVFFLALYIWAGGLKGIYALRFNETSFFGNNYYGSSGFNSGSGRQGIIIQKYPGSGIFDEYLVLERISGGPIDATGWTLENGLGQSFRIPQGHSLPSITPITEDIILPQSGRIVIHTSSNPIAMNFRENMCTGYFSEFYPFNPPLRNNCPLPSSSDFSSQGLSQDCIQYVQNQPACKTVSPASIPSHIGALCSSYVANTLNYGGCVRLHRNDSNFYGNTWQVFLNSSVPFITSQSKIVVKDKNKKIIASE